MTSVILIVALAYAALHGGRLLARLLRLADYREPETQPCRNVWCSVCRDESASGCPACQQRVGP